MKRLLALLFIVIGAGLLLGAWSQYRAKQDIVDAGRTVTGRVVDISQKEDFDGDPTYAPIYGYEVDGQQYRHEPSVTNSTRPSIGETETLYVDPADPSNAFADTFSDRWFYVTMLGGFGAAALIAGLMLLTSGRGRRRKVGDVQQAPPLQAPTQAQVASTTRDQSGPFVSGNSDANKGPFL